MFPGGPTTRPTLMRAAKAGMELAEAVAVGSASLKAQQPPPGLAGAMGQPPGQMPPAGPPGPPGAPPGPMGQPPSPLTPPSAAPPVDGLTPTNMAPTAAALQAGGPVGFAKGGLAVRRVGGPIEVRRVGGPIEPGNIDLSTRPVVKNGDKFSTVRSKSWNFEGNEVLLPTVSDDGRLLTDDEAIDQYRKTGRHLGIFKTPADATAYALKLHQDQEEAYKGEAKARGFAKGGLAVRRQPNFRVGSRR